MRGCVVDFISTAAMMWIDPSGVKFGMDPLSVLLRAKMPWPHL